MLTDLQSLTHLQKHVTLMEVTTSHSPLSSLWKHLCLFTGVLSLTVSGEVEHLAAESTHTHILMFIFFSMQKYFLDFFFCKSRCNIYGKCSLISAGDPLILLSAFCLVCITLTGCHLQILHGSHATGTFSGVFPINQTQGTLFLPCLRRDISGTLALFHLFTVWKV